jgi:hypothetical protein
MTESSEARSKGWPLKVVISEAMFAGASLRVGTLYRRQGRVVEKERRSVGAGVGVGVVAWPRAGGGVLKLGLHARCGNARNNRDALCILRLDYVDSADNNAIRSK